MNRSDFRKAVLRLCAAALFFAAAPAKSQIPPPAHPLPNLSLVCIGVSQYLDVSNTLQFPAQDALAVARTFQEQQGKAFGKVACVTLTDRRASREAIIAALVALRRQAARMGPDDYTIIYAVGHGTNDDLGQYFFAPFDVDADSIDSTCVDWMMFSRTLACLPGHVVMMLDTGHAGGVVVPANAVFMAACGKGELSQESTDWNHGAFAKALLEGLQGLADSDHNGTVTLVELADYTGKRVAVLTKNAQHPVFINPKTMPVALPMAVVPQAH